MEKVRNGAIRKELNVVSYHRHRKTNIKMVRSFSEDGGKKELRKGSPQKKGTT